MSKFNQLDSEGIWQVQSLQDLYSHERPSARFLASNLYGRYFAGVGSRVRGQSALQ